jgi:hypothetical protein
MPDDWSHEETDDPLYADRRALPLRGEGEPILGVPSPGDPSAQIRRDQTNIKQITFATKQIMIAKRDGIC